MTTIAYKDGVIAFDSRCCRDNTIMDDDFLKRISRDGVEIFYSGSTADAQVFADHWFGDRQSCPGLDTAAYVWDG